MEQHHNDAAAGMPFEGRQQQQYHEDEEQLDDMTRMSYRPLSLLRPANASDIEQQQQQAEEEGKGRRKGSQIEAAIGSGRNGDKENRNGGRGIRRSLAKEEEQPLQEQQQLQQQQKEEQQEPPVSLASLYTKQQPHYHQAAMLQAIKEKEDLKKRLQEVDR